jgi:hypothetical protein
MKSNQEIAKEIFQGKWGENLERKRRLIEAGYDYDKVMSIVNAIAAELPIEEILKRAEEYDKEHGIIPIEIHGTETLEIEVDLNKYNSIKLTFVSAEKVGTDA